MKRSEMLTILLGLVIAGAGLYFMFRGVSGDKGYNTGEAVSHLIMLFGGTFIALLLRKDIRYSTIAAVLIIGISSMASNIYYIFFSDDQIAILFADIYIIFSVVMIYYGVALLFHTSASSVKALVCLGILAATEFVPTLFKLYSGNDFMPFINTNMDKLAYGIVHLTVVIILSRKEMLLEGPKKRLDRNSKALYNGRCTPSGCFIDVHDIDSLLDDFGEGWITYDNGPIECERTISLYETDLGLRLQKWKGDDRKHIAVCVYGADSYTIPLAFPIEHIVMDNEDRSKVGKIRFYGDEGVFMDILVKDYDEQPKGYIETIRMKYLKKE